MLDLKQLNQALGEHELKAAKDNNDLKAIFKGGIDQLRKELLNLEKKHYTLKKEVDILIDVRQVQIGINTKLLKKHEGTPAKSFWDIFK